MDLVERSDSVAAVREYRDAVIASKREFYEFDWDVMFQVHRFKTGQGYDSEESRAARKERDASKRDCILGMPLPRRIVGRTANFGL
jgi:hypothetical protein